MPRAGLVVFRLCGAVSVFTGSAGGVGSQRTNPNPISIRGRFHNMSQCLHQPAQSCSLLFSAIQSKPTRCGRLVS